MYAIIKETSKFYDELKSEGFNEKTVASYVTKFFHERLHARAEAGKLIEEAEPKKISNRGGSIIP